MLPISSQVPPTARSSRGVRFVRCRSLLSTQSEPLDVERLFSRLDDSDRCPGECAGAVTGSALIGAAPDSLKLRGISTRACVPLKVTLDFRNGSLPASRQVMVLLLYLYFELKFIGQFLGLSECSSRHLL